MLAFLFLLLSVLAGLLTFRALRPWYGLGQSIIGAFLVAFTAALFFGLFL
jgi:hypothetical protein